MPSWDVVAGSWTVNWAAACLLLPVAVAYARGLAAARRQGLRWKVWRAAAFYVLGLCSFIVLSFGFPAVYSHDLRWVFTLKITGYLLVVTLLVALGQPLTLAWQTLGTVGAAGLEAFLNHRAMRLLRNTFVSALLGVALFSVFLTPLLYPLRSSTASDMALTLAVPLMGFQLAALTREHLANRRDHDGRPATEPAISSPQPSQGPPYTGGRETVR